MIVYGASICTINIWIRSIALALSPVITGTLVTIDSGEDKLEKTSKTGQNLKKGIVLYFITALLSTLALFVLSSIVLGNLG